MSDDTKLKLIPGLPPDPVPDSWSNELTPSVLGPEHLQAMLRRLAFEMSELGEARRRRVKWEPPFEFVRWSDIEPDEPRE